MPATECAKRLESLLLGYRKGRRERESFTDWCARIGDEEVAKQLSDSNDHPLADAEDVFGSFVEELDELGVKFVDGFAMIG